MAEADLLGGCRHHHLLYSESVVVVGESHDGTKTRYRVGRAFHLVLLRHSDAGLWRDPRHYRPDRVSSPAANATVIVASYALVGTLNDHLCPHLHCSLPAEAQVVLTSGESYGKADDNGRDCRQPWIFSQPPGNDRTAGDDCGA